MRIWTSPSLYRPQGRSIETTWTALGERFEHPRQAEHKGLLSRWAPVEFRHGYRCRANVVRCHAVTLDVDDGSPLDPILAAFSTLFIMVHSTFSSTPEAPRWRIVVPLDRAVDGDAYERVWRWLATALEAENVGPDFSARDASRAWAVPAIPPSGYYVVRQTEGALASVADALIAVPVEEPLPGPSPRQDDSYDARVRRARLYVEKMPPAISGSGGSTATLKAAIALVRGFVLEPDDALSILATDYNPRCQPEWTLADLRHKVRQAMQRGRAPYGFLATRVRS